MMPSTFDGMLYTKIRMRGLLIGDDAEKLIDVRNFLLSVPIEAGEALGWTAGLQLAARHTYDMIGVLFSSPVQIDGLVRLQEQCRHVPIIGFAATTEPLQTSEVLRAGAADLITLPINSEAVARLDAVLRRSYGLHGGILDVGPISIEPASRCVTVQGARLHFTEKEYGVIEMLALRHDRAVSKEAIAARLHGVANQRTMRLVDDYISRVRKKLRFACEGADFIITHVNRSYILRSVAGTSSGL